VVQEIGNRRKELNVQADRLQQMPNRIAQPRIVVDDNDGGAWFKYRFGSR